ncbi:hypothetical protein QBC33DRAFT_623903 [Phialemonium atrogriseum]|uniref:Uncharacterized protein n=1 Tax=Phialemonium atrogriseum TaxID=1093897 RepID=A0AAJ0BS66_9PEZI|nr:uncharacterized protein QBC33DRAFT_623903 [Phialemonium atrogriseum]KAK1762139.1 hypothetical protein QBC33DRAFT_623903 [Phialemonium atrogriseum]
MQPAMPYHPPVIRIRFRGNANGVMEVELPDNRHFRVSHSSMPPGPLEVPAFGPVFPDSPPPPPDPVHGHGGGYAGPPPPVHHVVGGPPPPPHPPPAQPVGVGGNHVGWNDVGGNNIDPPTINGGPPDPPSSTPAAPPPLPNPVPPNPIPFGTAQLPSPIMVAAPPALEDTPASPTPLIDNMAHHVPGGMLASEAGDASTIAASGPVDLGFGDLDAQMREFMESLTLNRRPAPALADFTTTLLEI